MQTINIPPDASKEEQDELNAKRGEINRKIVEILRPEILKLKDLLGFITQTINLFKETVQNLSTPEAREKVVPEGLYVNIIKLMDLMLKLDNLKDMKACLNNDFSRYKRAVGALVNQGGGGANTVLLDEQALLQPFINNVDPRKAKQWIYQTYRAEIKRIPNHEDVLIEVLDQATYNLENHVFTTPDEKFRYMRVIPYLLMLIDGNAEEPKSMNVFKNKNINISSIE